MSTLVTLPPFEMLLAEDHPGDVRLMREALKETGSRSTSAWRQTAKRPSPSCANRENIPGPPARQ